jgi:hypothetical protein
MDSAQDSKHLKIPVFFLGTFIGLVLAALVFLLIIFFSGLKSSSFQPDSKKSVFRLNISSPTNHLATSQKEIQISGNTGKNTVITINTDLENKILETNSSNFSTKILLKEGRNFISVSAHDRETGESQTVVREILYLEEELTNL